MILVQNWALILRKAWSVKFNAAATIFGGAEVAVAIIQPDSIPPGLFAGMAAFISMLASVARIMAQREVFGADK